MSDKVVPTADLSPAERVVSEIEAAKAAGDIGRVMDGLDGLDVIQRLLRRRGEQRELVNHAGAEKVRTERWIGLCILNGQVHKSDFKDTPQSHVTYFRYFARAAEKDFEQAITEAATNTRTTVTSSSVYRRLQFLLDPAGSQRLEHLARRRIEERRLRDLGRAELERIQTKKHVRMRARPLEVAIGAIHESLRALEEFDIRDENERIAYNDAVRLLHGAEDFVKIAAGYVHGND